MGHNCFKAACGRRKKVRKYEKKEDTQPGQFMTINMTLNSLTKNIYWNYRLQRDDTINTILKHHPFYPVHCSLTVKS